MRRGVKEQAVNHTYHVGDCLEVMRGMKRDSVDLVFTSPPYEDARLDSGNLTGDDYIRWALERFQECLRICRGVVCWVIEGRTRNYAYSLTPERLSVALWRAGAIPRKPKVYQRVGIFGGGGPDWFRNDWEPVLCFTRRQGRLPWSEPTACGHPPKCPPGGAPSHHSRDGRVNRVRPMNRRPNGEREVRLYKPPEKANPGNVIRGAVGGGHMGSKIAHENSAPFPEWLAERFVRSLCPPGGTVLDCFAGSGTTGAVAELWGRNSVLIDLRAEEIERCKRRIAEATERREKGKVKA